MDELKAKYSDFEINYVKVFVDRRALSADDAGDDIFTQSKFIPLLISFERKKFKLNSFRWRRPNFAVENVSIPRKRTLNNFKFRSQIDSLAQLQYGKLF